MVYSDVRVKVQTDAGTITLTDQLLGVEVADGLDSLPQGQVRLPLHRTTQGGRRRYSELIRPGDLCTVEMLAWDGKEGDWETVLQGPVVAVDEAEGLDGGVGTVLAVESAAHYLVGDQVAQWMWLGSVVGWQPVFSRLLVSQTVDRPHLVARRYLEEVAFHNANLRVFGLGLADLIRLEFEGLQAVAPLTYTLSTAEGPHLEIIRRFLDPPLQELYATTKAGKTTLIWRKAPYPYPDPGEWRGLKLHRLEGTWQPVRGKQAAWRLDRVRNFFLVYPAFTFADEWHLMALGVAATNAESVRRFGYRPLKVRTHLVHNERPLDQESILEFWKALTRRLAAQWNRLHEMAAGVLELPLAPWIRPGERIRFRNLWGTGELEAHVRGRALSWTPREGGRTQLAWERGLPPEVYEDPSWFGRGLEVVRVAVNTTEVVERELRRR